LNAVKDLSFPVLIIEYQRIEVWSNLKCHGCIHEPVPLCVKFGIHHSSDDVECLFCIHNPRALVPVKNHYKSMEEIAKDVTA